MRVGYAGLHQTFGLSGTVTIAINAGNTTMVHNRVKVMAMVKSTPMLAVPGWLDKAMLANEPIVVSALKNTARGVLVSRSVDKLFVDLCRRTKWIERSRIPPK